MKEYYEVDGDHHVPSHKSREHCAIVEDLFEADRSTVTNASERHLKCALTPFRTAESNNDVISVRLGHYDVIGNDTKGVFKMAEFIAICESQLQQNALR